jgi:hypothetical protein
VKGVGSLNIIGQMTISTQNHAQFLRNPPSLLQILYHPADSERSSLGKPVLHPLFCHIPQASNPSSSSYLGELAKFAFSILTDFG